MTSSTKTEQITQNNEKEEKQKEHVQKIPTNDFENGIRYYTCQSTDSPRSIFIVACDKNGNTKIFHSSESFECTSPEKYSNEKLC